MKTKGQLPKVAKLERLTHVFFCGGLAERSNAADCKSVNGGPPTVHGFGLAPKAGLFRSTVIVRPLPTKRKVHNYVSLDGQWKVAAVFIHPLDALALSPTFAP